MILAMTSGDGSDVNKSHLGISSLWEVLGTELRLEGSASSRSRWRKVRVEHGAESRQQHCVFYGPGGKGILKSYEAS